MNLKTGHMLKRGDYRVEKVLGVGGFGITYLCEQTALLRKVAVKEFFMKELCNRDAETSSVIVPSVGSREMVDLFRQKFIKEARIIATFGFNNKHIVRIIDVFEEKNTAYYVMEYVGGGSLSDKVKDGALSESAAVRYIRQVASALEFVHSKRMMHLDVKPANILLNDNDESVLIDFGLAKQYDTKGSQTSTTPVGISHGYAPLEQYKRGGVGVFSPATDIYSLGATLYRLLTGQTPPEAGDVNDDGLPELPRHITASVRVAIEAAMQPRRKERPQSIAEFLALLEGKDEKAKSKDESGDEIVHVGSSLPIVESGQPRPLEVSSFEKAEEQPVSESTPAPEGEALHSDGDGDAVCGNVDSEPTAYANQSIQEESDGETVLVDSSFSIMESGLQCSSENSSFEKKEERSVPENTPVSGGEVSHSDGEKDAVRGNVNYKSTTQSTKDENDGETVLVDSSFPIVESALQRSSENPSFEKVENRSGSGSIPASVEALHSNRVEKPVRRNVDSEPAVDANPIVKDGGDDRTVFAANDEKPLSSREKANGVADEAKAYKRNQLRSNSKGNSLESHDSAKKEKLSSNSRHNDKKRSEDVPKKHFFNKKRITVISLVAICIVAALFGIKSYNKDKTVETEIKDGETPSEQVQVTPGNNGMTIHEYLKPVQTSGMINGHEWVDLGLSVKWATCNVGASTPGDYGDYYAWGELFTKDNYTEETCTTNNKQISSIAGDNTYDVASNKWGDNWRMPTKAEFQELIDNCTWRWAVQNGHKGYKVTSKKNNNSIFLPITGWRYGTSIRNRGTGGYYWSASILENDARIASLLYISDGSRKIYWADRCGGRCVRPVVSE